MGRRGPAKIKAAATGRCDGCAAIGRRADCCKKASWAGCENAADINNDAKMKQINLCIERRTMAGCKFTPVGLAGLWWLPIANKFYKWLSDKV